MADDAQHSHLRRAPMIGVLLIASGAALWGLDGTLRTPLVDSWSPWTIVLDEHIILTACVLPFLIRHRGGLKALDARGWASALVIAWGASALATLAFTTAFQYGNPSVVVLLQKTQPLWAIAAAALVVRELPRPQILVLLVPAGMGTYLLSFGWASPGDAFDGAAGRAALLALASARLGVPASELRVRDGVVFAAAEPSKRATYGELVGDRTFNVKVSEKPKLKEPSEYRVAG